MLPLTSAPPPRARTHTHTQASASQLTSPRLASLLPNSRGDGHRRDGQGRVCHRLRYGYRVDRRARLRVCDGGRGEVEFGFGGHMAGRTRPRRGVPAGASQCLITEPYGEEISVSGEATYERSRVYV